MKPIRSFLFVPGSRESWLDKVVSAGADALILDLEDSVPNDAKAAARELVARKIAGLADAGQRVYVRINRSPFMYSMEDLLAVAVPGLEGIVLSKPNGPEDIDMASMMVAEAELRNGLVAGSIGLVPTLETARSIQFAHEIALRPRVTAIAIAAAKNGDVARSVGFQWTREGLESLPFKVAGLIAARAAGKMPIAGLWQEVHDIEGLKIAAAAHRRLGFVGEMLLHPSNVGPVNAIYSPSDEDVAFYSGMIEAFERAQAEGRAAVIYDGEHIDYAHVKTAREIVEQARLFRAAP
ncbi:HpcH/HpaI aldolase/citrate lyase family protein [Piscinibacter sakaiensis]|uniref:HpcH/HpaI aldolase/citrate lyase family protein n=1 Tax=Piscinibacter sakaiensis TaxID=1547922 RepID=UPI003AAE3740